MPKGATKAAKPGDAKSNEDDASSSDKPDAAGANNETPADGESPDNVVAAEVGDRALNPGFLWDVNLPALQRLKSGKG